MGRMGQMGRMGRHGKRNCRVKDVALYKYVAPTALILFFVRVLQLCRAYGAGFKIGFVIPFPVRNCTTPLPLFREPGPLLNSGDSKLEI